MPQSGTLISPAKLIKKEKLYQLKRVKSMILYITQVFQKSLHKVHLEDLAPVFPNFTVMQLNRYQEHPGLCELALEEESVNKSS